MGHRRPDISIIVPAYNEEGAIALLYEQVVANVEPDFPNFELIVVDDGSKDRTFEILEELAQKDERLVVVKFLRNFGQTPSMAAGIDLARGPILVTLDADLQNDPADIPALVAKVKEGYDLAVGYRIRRQDKFFTRKLPSIIANRLIGKVTGLPIRDNGCSLKAYRAEVIKRVPLYSDMHRFIPSMSIPSGVSVAEVGVRHHARQFGESKYGLFRIYRVFFDLLAVRLILTFSARPLACFSGLFAISFAATAGFVIAALTSNADSNVVFSTLAVLSGSLTVFLVSAGVIVGLMQDGARTRAPDTRQYSVAD